MPNRLARMGLAAVLVVTLVAGTPSTVAGVSASATSELPSGRTTYRTPSDVQHDLAGLVRRRPDLVKPITLPHKTLTGKTVSGVEISHDVAKPDGKPAFLLTGLHHAREWPTAEVAVEFAIDLVQKDGNDPRITGLLRQVRVIVVPVVNPDGFALSRDRTIEFKRKNCRVNDALEVVTMAQCADPKNAKFGVDLNRNYGVNWGGMKDSTDPNNDPYENYRGKGPFSEPEARNIRDLVSSRQVMMASHLHNWAYSIGRPPSQQNAADTPDEPTYAAIGAAMSKANGYPSVKINHNYSFNGEVSEWSYFTTGGFSFTTELGPKSAPDPNDPYSGFHPAYQLGVIDQYFGIGSVTGANGGTRESLLVAMETAANRAYHSVIVGNAPWGARLTVRKKFTQFTAPVLNPDGTYGPARPFESTLESSMIASGAFAWDVNPSIRPATDGTTIAERWTMRCARPDGTVLQQTEVRIARGDRVAVNLSACAARWGG